MKLAIVGLLSVVAFQNYPPPFPREGITRAFENDRVVVWHGRFPKGRPTAMHEHTLDLVGVFLSEGRVRVALQDGSTREGKPFNAGHVVFQPKGVIHTEESLVEGTEAVGIELKVRNASAPADEPNLPKAFPRHGATLLFENERVAIWDTEWQSSPLGTIHFHDKDAVVVPIEEGRVNFALPGRHGRVMTLKYGQPTWMPRGESDREEPVEGTPKAIIVELKEP